MDAYGAIETMGGLAEEYGFYSNAGGTPDAPVFDDTAECLGVSDADGNVWVFNIMTGLDAQGAIWAAQRLADDSATVIANAISIRGMDLGDKANFRASAGIVDVAHSAEW